MIARRWTVALWVLAGFFALILLLKFFVADIYRVDSGSMRPTIFGGRNRADAEEDTEHVLVLYDREFEPERFDLVVVRSPDGTKPLVKRVCGIPGDEDFMIRGGDLFVGRKHLPPETPRPPPLPVYDDRYQEAEQFFEYRRDGSVRREGEEWVVDGGVQPPGSLLLYHPKLRDDYFDRQHRLFTGVIEVNDAVLELEFLVEPPLLSQKLRFELVEQGDTFEVVLAAAPDGRSRLRLVRRSPRMLQESRELLLAEAPLDLVAGRWFRFVFSNIDNHLRVRAPELGVDLGHSYAENEPWPAPLPLGQLSLGPRVHFGAEAGRARFRGVRILRDLYYTDDGQYGTESRNGSGEARETATVSLGPGDYFVLGDNSAASTDSRHFGQIKASRIIGRPLAVLWPVPRRLRAAAPPP